MAVAACTLLAVVEASADERAPRWSTWDSVVEPSELDPMTLDEDLDVGAVRPSEGLVCPSAGTLAGALCPSPFEAGLDARIGALRRASPAKFLPRVSVAMRAVWEGGRQVTSEALPTRAGLDRGVEWLIVASWEGP